MPLCLLSSLLILLLSTAASAADLTVVSRHDHGLLAKLGPKTILWVKGTPQQMGHAHGTLLADKARALTDRVVYAVGAADTLRSGTWFFDRMADIERRTTPHIPQRYFEECDALAAAAGLSRRDARYANLFPELFHCSGVALRGKATKNGQVLHARVLDYMRDIGLQSGAAVVVFQPQGRHAWISLGYGGLIGTVTAMNEKGLAIGEMGGQGQGNWDGMPMTLLLREVMETTETVDQAIDLLKRTPRTCEYYYVLSDKHGAIASIECRPDHFLVLSPGQQHPRLPRIPDDVVLISGPDRAKSLAQRIEKSYGSIDVPTLIEMIKRPVAMSSNLHNAVFSPQTLEMWFADAGRKTPACDEPYHRVHLPTLLDFYRQHAK